MGNQTMRITCFVAFAIFVAVECAPMPGSEFGSTPLTEVISEIKAAAQPLRNILDDEKTEIAEMQDVAKAVENEPTPQQDASAQKAVSEEAERIHFDTKKAIEQEKASQNNALESLAKVNDLINLKFQDNEFAGGKGTLAPETKLGESPETETDPQHHALLELQKVSASLTADTQTMTSEGKMETMLDEAVEIEKEAEMEQHDQPEGETMLGGVMGDLQVAANLQAQAEHKTAMPRILDTEMKQFEDLHDQSVKLEAAETGNRVEVSQLLKEMS